MALKHRTCIAALAAQRNIATAEQSKKISSSHRTGGSPHSHSRYSNSAKDLADHELQYISTATEMIQKLRELAPNDSGASEDTGEGDYREYTGLQDEIYRVAHNLEHKAFLSKKESDTERDDNDIHLDGYQPMSFELDNYEGRRMIKINLLKSQGFTSQQNLSSPSETKNAPIYRLENALFDLSSYRQYIKSQPQQRPSEAAKSEINKNSNLDFSKASAKFMHQVITVNDDTNQDEETPDSLVLSLLNSP